MRILKQGTVYRVTEGPFRYQAWPTVCMDEHGVLYAAWSGHRSSHVCPFGKNMMAVSRDGGESWSVPSVINDTWLDDRDAGLSYLGDGRLLLTYFHHPKDRYYKDWRDWIIGDADERYRPLAMGMLESYRDLPAECDTPGSFIKLSPDYGASWGEAIKMPVTAPHGPVLTPSGRLLYLGKEFFSGGDAEDAEQILLYESMDGGHSWERRCRLDTPAGFTARDLHEPHLAELPDGTLVAAIRTENHPTLHTFTICFATSTDGGRSFSRPAESGIKGSPPHLRVLSDGSLLCTYGRRTSVGGACGIRAVRSTDGGRSFGEEMILTESHSADLGYPATVELADGSLLTVYYQRYSPEDNRTSILYTKWMLDE